jgi:hypothetical protein
MENAGYAASDLWPLLTYSVVDVGKSGRNGLWVIFPVQLAMEVGRGGVLGIPRAFMLKNNVELNPMLNPTKAPCNVNTKAFYEHSEQKDKNFYF